MLNTRHMWRWLWAGLLIIPLFILTNSNPTTVSRAEDEAVRPEFKTVYEMTDLPVLQGRATRSWVWGPAGFKTDNEPYEDAPGGKRLVQYFDKGRLELNNPTNSVVTSGLLAKELMTGQLQLSDGKFETRGPSSLSVAGDFDDVSAPSYADLGLLFDKPALTVSQVISTYIRPDGTQSLISKLADYKVTAVEYAAGSKHTIANVFKDFLNLEGLVYKNGAFVQGKIFENTAFATGLPLTEPYWASAKVGGKVQDVLVQGFERRVLTYTPANSVGFQVEAGNIGRHYYQWRYEVTELQLLSLNDFHGRLLPEVSNNVPRGGAAYITTLVNQLRDANPNTLLIHAGDGAGAT